MDAVAILMNDRTLVPMRAISEAFGCKVDWDEATKTVGIQKTNRSDSGNALMEFLQTRFDKTPAYHADGRLPYDRRGYPIQ